MHRPAPAGGPEYSLCGPADGRATVSRRARCRVRVSSRPPRTADRGGSRIKRARNLNRGPVHACSIGIYAAASDGRHLLPDGASTGLHYCAFRRRRGLLNRPLAGALRLTACTTADRQQQPRGCRALLASIPRDASYTLRGRRASCNRIGRPRTGWADKPRIASITATWTPIADSTFRVRFSDNGAAGSRVHIDGRAGGPAGKPKLDTDSSGHAAPADRVAGRPGRHHDLYYLSARERAANDWLRLLFTFAAQLPAGVLSGGGVVVKHEMTPAGSK